MTIADTLRIIRKDYGLTQAELGARLGMSQGQVAHVEAGRKELSPLVVAILSSARLRDYFLRGRVKVEAVH